jgi:hypothetical protein
LTGAENRIVGGFHTPLIFLNEETESNAEADTTKKGDLIDKRLLIIKFESSYHEVAKTGVCEMENQ